MKGSSVLRRVHQSSRSVSKSIWLILAFTPTLTVELTYANVETERGFWLLVNGPRRRIAHLRGIHEVVHCPQLHGRQRVRQAAVALTREELHSFLHLRRFEDGRR